MKRSALATVPADDLTAPARHLRPVEEERRGAKFAALDHDVARVLGPQRGAAVLYGFLASTWYEFADPAKLVDRKRKITPGDWVEVDYRQFMQISGTNARASIIRWLRILAEDMHACPWGRCGDEHPLIVVHRQGQSRPNRYRKWRCSEDVLVVRRRVRSERLSEVAKQRVAAGQRLNGIAETLPAVPALDTTSSDVQLALLANTNPEVSAQDFSEVSSQDGLKSNHETSSSLGAELQEVSPLNGRKSYDETSLRGKILKTDSVGLISNATAEKPNAAAIEEVDEVDAVACEVVDAIMGLAQRTEPAYPEERAWLVARKLAAAVLTVAAGQASAARALLLHAIADRRLARASNPIGLLIRGVTGDGNGADRYLLTNHSPGPAAPQSGPPVAPSITYPTSTGLPPGLHDALVDAVRAGRSIDDNWLRERGISRQALAIAKQEVANEEEQTGSSTPLGDALAATDPETYQTRLQQILAELELPAALGVTPSLEHPMLLGMCRSRLEIELATDPVNAPP